MSERREINGAPFILRMLADEIEANESLNLEAQWAARTIAGLVSEIDHLQEQWMDDNTAHNDFVKYLMDEDIATRLEYRDEVKAEFRANLEAAHSEHARLEGLLSMAHRRIVELEAIDRQQADLTHRLEGAKDATARNLDLTSKIAEAVAELTRLGNEQGGDTTAECHRIANRLRGGAKRPEPGMEVEI